MDAEAERIGGLPRLRLWAEFLGLFIGVPLLMFAFFGQYPLLPVVLALGGVALLLLRVTPGYEIADLWRGGLKGSWPLVLGFFVACAASCIVTAWYLVPERLFSMPVERPGLWLLIMVAYPFASALPQELIYRPLFFRRYGQLFPNEATAVVMNALLFGLGHLFYQNPVTIGLTTLASAFFAIAYLRYGSFPLAFALHALGGQIVFTTGLGIFFYHGAVGAAP